MIGRVDLLTGTLRKARGGASGGYTSGRRELIELLRERSRPYLFSNSLTPPIVAAWLKALQLLSQTTELRAKLADNTRFFRQGREYSGVELLPGEHPIVQIMLGEPALARQFADALLGRGVYVIGFSYPVVPGELRQTQPDNLGQVASHDPLIFLRQTAIASRPQCALDKTVDPRAAAAGEAHPRLAASQRRIWVGVSRSAFCMVMVIHPQCPHPSRLLFQDHLVLETNTPFRIISRWAILLVVRRNPNGDNWSLRDVAETVSETDDRRRATAARSRQWGPAEPSRTMKGNRFILCLIAVLSCAAVLGKLKGTQLFVLTEIMRRPTRNIRTTSARRSGHWRGRVRSGY